jgi:Uma2 family endonuclease
VTQTTSQIKAQITYGLTAEAFWSRYGGQRGVELVNGAIEVRTMPVNTLHGTLVIRLGQKLNEWAEIHGGLVVTEVGFLLKRNPDLLRAPDIAYIFPFDAITDSEQQGFRTQPPMLAAEVVSDSDTPIKMTEKVMQYLEAGVAVVWVIYPTTRQIVVHTADNSPKTLDVGEILQDSEVLPGFLLALSWLFR